MCFISLDKEKLRLFFDVVFVCVPYLDTEIPMLKTPYFWYT